MCELLRDDSNNKRRRNKAHMMLSIMLNTLQHHNSDNSNIYHASSMGRGPQYRRLCLLTTALAFVLGLLVGVMIPLFFLPRTLSADFTKLPHKSANQSWTRDGANVSSDFNITRPVLRSNLTNYLRIPERADVLNENLHTVNFSSVSFVRKSSKQMPPLLRQRLYGGGGAGGGGGIDARQGGGLKRSKFTVGIYWSDAVEKLLPPGFERDASTSWRRFARRTSVVKVEEGCGRMQNRLLTYEDGTKSCCRYRQNTDQIQGELFSFYLGDVLRLRNLAPSSLALVKLDTELFAKVKPQLNLAQWAEDRAVVLTKFVDNLEPAYIPTALRTHSRRLHPVDVEAATDAELVDLAQWSDLIVFDYLTANLDRVVNNLYNLQWNSAMMESPAHNLAKDPKTGLLVFFDNESGLLHGYRLLDKYEQYHLALLEALCIFRRPTVEVIRELHSNRDVGERLQKFFETNDPEFRDVLPNLPDKSVKILNERIDKVYDQITMCERQYASR